MHTWKARRRRRKQREGALGALGAILAPHELIVYLSFWSELSRWNKWLRVGPRVTLLVSLSLKYACIHSKLTSLSLSLKLPAKEPFAPGDGRARPPLAVSSTPRED